MRTAASQIFDYQEPPAFNLDLERQRGPSSQPARSASLVFPERDPELRIGLAQIRTLPGKILENESHILDLAQEARHNGVKFLAYPENCLPAYLHLDRIFNPNYLSQQFAALRRIAASVGDMTVAIPFTDLDLDKVRPGGRPYLYNSVATFENGKLLNLTRKDHLCDYEVFDETRWWVRGGPSHPFDTKIGRAGVTICEDMWKGYDTDPIANFASAKLDFLLNCSFSPFEIGKLPTRFNLVSQAARLCQAPMAYVNGVGGYDGFQGNVVGDGRSMVVGPDGSLLALGKAFDEELLIVDLFSAPIISLPNFPASEELYDALVCDVRDYCLRTGLSKIHLGLSGGIDSAVIACICRDAIGPERVFTWSMPSRFNKSDEIEDARQLAANLGVRFEVIPMEEYFNAIRRTLAGIPDFESSKREGDTTDENIQAAARSLLLARLANRYGGSFINTSNATESVLNNMTYAGDNLGYQGPLQDVSKVEIYAMVQLINQKAGFDRIPQRLVDRIPSAGLKADQVDADVMGADPREISALADDLRHGMSLSEALAQHQGKGDKLVRESWRKLSSSEWKRRQMGPGTRVHVGSFGRARQLAVGDSFESTEVDPLVSAYFSEKLGRDI